MADRNYDYLFKVLLCGDSGVGKTCLISQFTDQQVRKSHITTIGIDFKLKTFNVQGKRIRLQIWDTAGQERFETLTAQYYRRAQGILLVYDITQEQTFVNVSKWLRNIEENAVEDVKLLLVGNKVDLEDQRQVTTRRGEKLAKQHSVTFLETSAWTNVNITTAFTTLAQEILESTENKIRVQRGEGNGTLGRSKIVLGEGESNEDPGEGGGGLRAVTGNKGVDVAMDWLLAHQEDSDESGHQLGTGEGLQPSTDTASAADLQPKSLKCDDCGKLLKSELDAQAHAARTKHQNFSESTEELRPLTEEEKKEQLVRLEERLKQKRAEREKKEKEETIEHEKARRKTGKELAEIRHEMELQEARKIAEERKREKREERLARQKVKEEIARDRAERQARQKEKAPPVAVPQPASTAVKKDYDTCRLQIRLMEGGALVHTFKATDTLVEVQRHVMLHQSAPNTPFSLMTTFPKRVFTANDMGTTLKDLGLVPSAVLIQSKQ